MLRYTQNSLLYALRERTTNFYLRCCVTYHCTSHNLIQSPLQKLFVLRSIASFASNCCSTLSNNLLLQKVEPVHIVSQLFINLQLDSTHFWHYRGTYQSLGEVDTVDMSPQLLEAATTATSLQSQLTRRRSLFRGPSSNMYMGPSIDKSSLFSNLSVKSD